MTSERRPRLDAVIRAIKEGKYDEELVEISKAINDRIEDRKRAVMELVKQTFGEDAVVQDAGKLVQKVARKPKQETENTSGLNVTKHGEPSDFDPDAVLVDPAPGEVIAAEKPPQEGLTGEYESRSPQFGSIDTKEGE